MSVAFRLRVRCALHQNVPLIDFLTPDSTFENLNQVLASATEILEDQLKVLGGYPPKVLNGTRNTKLKDIGLKNGELLIIEKRVAGDPPQYSEASNTSHSTSTIECSAGEANKKKDGQRLCAGMFLTPGSPLGVLQKLEVPSNNSCLFASMDYVINGSMSQQGSQQLRQEVSQAVLQEPPLVPDCVLDQPRQEYSAWILREQSWGGEIELAILSKRYSIEIVAVDAKTARVNRFGEAEDYEARVFLLYDGIHYDPLHMESLSIQGKFYTSFPGSLDAVLAQAVDIAGQAHKSGSFTDTDNFTLQCGECGHKLKGEVEALQHARQTSHTDFQEVNASVL